MSDGSLHRFGRWWVAVLVAAAVLIVGAITLVAAGRLGDGDHSDDAATAAGDGAPVAARDDIAGRWVLDAWQEGDVWIAVVVGDTTVEAAWLEFTPTFEGERDGFVSADGLGTAGTFTGSTGCNTVGGEYEYSAGFLVIVGAQATEIGCDPADAEVVLLAMLWNTPDGIETIASGDSVEWYGSNLEGRTWPLRFHREGAPPPSDDGDAPSDVEAAMRVFDIGGVEVVTLTDTGLPDTASVVRFRATVIDSGDGPELCIGGVADSLPPQCSGPVAAGLDMDGWSEEANGVRWGDREVVVSWPPVDGTVQLVSDDSFEPSDVVYPPGELPGVCRDVDARIGAQALNDYARSIGDRNGGLYLANDGTLVLQVVGDPEPHRAALEGDGGACVVAVPRSEADQRRIQDAIVPLLTEAIGPSWSSVSTGPGGRVEVGVAVADRATVEAIAALVDDPEALRVIGIGGIVE